MLKFEEPRINVRATGMAISLDVFGRLRANLLVDVIRRVQRDSFDGGRQHREFPYW
jgi:hypothetical protein